MSLEILWRPFEIHPDVPPGGVPLSSLGYDAAELEAAMENLRRQAAEEGLDFAPRTPASLLVNTHRALAASAVVRAEDPGRFEAFHLALFRAVFGQGRDVGKPSVLREVAAAAGLDAARLDAALEGGGGEAILREAAADARRHGISAVPAFVFGGNHLVVGAHQPAVLARAAERAAQAG